MSSTKENGFPLQVTTGALAAATAALLGSTLGVAGTVLGAGIASVVTTVGAALYLRSIQRTREGVRLVQDKVRGRWTATIPAATDEPGEATDEQPEATGDEPDGAEEPVPRRRIGWPVLVAASVLAFVLGLGVITGLELLRGEPVSGGQGTTIGRIVDPRQGPAQERDPAPPAPSTPSVPAPTSTVTVTVAPTTTTRPPDASQPPATTGSARPPVTTTTPAPPPSGQPEPSGVG